MRARTIAAVGSTLLICAAQAQPGRPGDPPTFGPPPNQNTCPPDSRGSAPRSDETAGGRTLSDQLAESKGVICPPAGVDPGITVPPIGGGRMPVIPPPGTPGGDPNIQPK